MGKPERPADFEISYKGGAWGFCFPSAEDHISATIMQSGTFYELELLESIAMDLREGDVVVDAGANIGNHSVYLAGVLGCHVEAFEAVKATADLLEQNILLNGLEGRVTVHRQALGAGRQRAKIAEYNPSNVGGTSLAIAADGEISVAPLDEIGIRRPVRLIKIDVEGMDLDVLRGAKTIISEDRPWIVCEAGSSQQFQAVSNFLSGAGYQFVGVYNATDTYMFLPASSKSELASLLVRSAETTIQLQRDLREAQSRIAQVGRYSERMRQEALTGAHEEFAAMESKIERIEKQVREIADVARLRAQITRLNDEAAVIRHEYDALSTKAAADTETFRRVIQIKDATIADARSALDQERTQRAEEASSLRQRIKDAHTEVERVVHRFSELSEGSSKQIAELNRKVSHFQARVTEEERRVASAQSEFRAAKMRWDHSQRLVTRERDKLRIDVQGLHGRHAKAEEREKKSAYNELKLRRALRAEAAKGATTKAELQSLRSSLSFKLGAHLVTALRSPLGALKLPYTSLILVWQEFRVRRSAKVAGSTTRKT